MDLTLLLLVAEWKRNGGTVRAGSMAEPACRTVRDVRASLARLERLGLVKREKVASRGPLGTFAWAPTAAGLACAEPALDFITAPRRAA